MPKESLETLISELVHEEEWRRMRATAACLSGGPKAVTGLIQALNTGSPTLKIEVIRMLARLKDHKAGVALVHRLRDDDPAVRKSSAEALEHMAGILDLEAASALVGYLKDSQDDEQTRLVRHLLGVIPNAIEPLTALLKHPDEAVRLTAADILDHLLDPRSADAFVDVMGDAVLQDTAVRALKKLGAIRDRVDRLFDALREVDDSSMREEARMATVIELLNIGRPLVEILIEYLQDEDWVVREAAADLLGKIGDIRAVEPLMERLQRDKDTGVKEIAIKSLGLIGDARPVELFVEALPIKPLRVYAMEALAKVKDVEPLKAHVELFKKLKTDRDGLVSYNSTVILDKLAALEAQTAQVAAQEGADDA